MCSERSAPKIFLNPTNKLESVLFNNLQTLYHKQSINQLVHFVHILGKIMRPWTKVSTVCEHTALYPLLSFGEGWCNTVLKGVYLTYLTFDSLKQLIDSLHSKKSAQGTRQSHKLTTLYKIRTILVEKYTNMLLKTTVWLAEVLVYYTISH